MNTNNIQHIDQVRRIAHLKDKFVIMNSAILVLLGLKRGNKDIDLLVTNDFPKDIQLSCVSFNRWSRWEHRLSSFASNTDDFIMNHSFELDGISFCKIEESPKIPVK